MTMTRAYHPKALSSPLHQSITWIFFPRQVCPCAALCARAASSSSSKVIRAKSASRRARCTAEREAPAPKDLPEGRTWKTICVKIWRCQSALRYLSTICQEILELNDKFIRNLTALSEKYGILINNVNSRLQVGCKILIGILELINIFLMCHSWWTFRTW